VNGLPPGVQSAYTLRAAAAALQLDERRLLEWCRAGYIAGWQPSKKRGGRWLLPTVEIQRIAGHLLITPDWGAAEDADGV
jgi:hypothetical protein